jgi:hypothetical protein
MSKGNANKREIHEKEKKKNAGKTEKRQKYKKKRIIGYKRKRE